MGYPELHRPECNGTGGLLIIYGNNIINNSNITSKGIAGGNAWAGGGSSGGGSINIFYRNNYEYLGTIDANGGEASGSNWKGRQRTEMVIFQ